jgi:carboxypeptidase C (cathepsin A)
MGLLQENGPCFINSDSNSTTLNPWSWNNEVNMLYLDQPTQVGFSYDFLTNVTVNLALTDFDDGADRVQPADFTDAIPKQNNTFLVGTMGSQSLNTTANTTVHAAHALWHFAQTWFSEFPAYKPHDDRVSLWTESYGGHYGPGFWRFFQEQNEKIKNGTIKERGTHYIHLDTLGLINALLDAINQLPAYVEALYNNVRSSKSIPDFMIDDDPDIRHPVGNQRRVREPHG